MADVQIARVGRTANESVDYRVLGNELAGLGQAINTRRVEGAIEEAAQDVQSFAEASRMFAEGNYSPSASPEARLRAAASQDPNVILAERANEIGADAARRFDRYRKAVEQGASNRSAARIAMQKEMRDLISQNPGYADVIRRAGDRALGNEEFQVMTRDLESPRNEQATEFQKFQANIAQQADWLRNSNGWTAEQTESWMERQIRTYIQSEDDARQNELLSNMDTGNARVATEKARLAGRQADTRVGEIADMVSLRISQGGTISPDEARQMLADLDNTIIEVEQQVRDAFLNVPSVAAGQVEQEMANSTRNLRAVRTAIVENRFDNVAAIQVEAIKNNQVLTFAELLPLESAIVNVFGESNLSYYAKALTNSDDPLYQRIFRHSPWFASSRERLERMGMSPEQAHSYFISEVAESLERWKGGQADPRDMEVVAGVAGAAGARPAAARNNDEMQKELFSVSGLTENAEQRRIGAAQIKASEGIDDHQFNAVRQFYLPAWNGAIRDAIESPIHGEERFFQLEIDGDGLPVIMRYTRVGEVTGSPETSPQIRRTVSRRLTDTYRDIFMKEQTQRGPRSMVERPRINQELFGGRSTGLIVSEYMAQLNGGADIPSWVPRAATSAGPGMESVLDYIPTVRAARAAGPLIEAGREALGEWNQRVEDRAASRREAWRNRGVADDE